MSDKSKVPPTSQVSLVERHKQLEKEHLEVTTVLHTGVFELITMRDASMEALGRLRKLGRLMKDSEIMLETQVSVCVMTVMKFFKVPQAFDVQCQQGRDPKKFEAIVQEIMSQACPNVLVSPNERRIFKFDLGGN